MNDEEKMRNLRREYESETMSEEGLEQMMEKIGQAKQEHKRIGWSKAGRTAVGIAAAAAIVVTVVNLSPSVSRAMSGIPVIGNIVKVISFRVQDYTKNEDNSLNIRIPKLKKNDSHGAGGESDKSTEEINKEILEQTKHFIKEFRREKEKEYGNLTIDYEIVNTQEDYFTLKLNCTQTAADEAEWNYYYTIDLHTGERMHLKDLYGDKKGYLDEISENIKEQMRSRMAEDSMAKYWLDDPEMQEDNFQEITGDTQFYINADGQLVIVFQEGDVAPMYMGIVEFIIPEGVADWK